MIIQCLSNDKKKLNIKIYTYMVHTESELYKTAKKINNWKSMSIITKLNEPQITLICRSLNTSTHLFCSSVY